MFTLIFDKGTSKEKRLLLQSFYERPISNVFTGSYTTVIKEESDIPDIEGFVGDSTFDSVIAVSSDGFRIPISGRYNYISDFSCNYDDETKRFGINLTLTWRKPDPEAGNAK